MDNHPRARVAIWRVAGWILSLAALGFLGKWLLNVDPAAWRTLLHLQPAWVVLSIGLFQLWFWLRYRGWEMISRSQGAVIERRQNMRMWTLSEIMRYIPGNVWSFAARYKGARTGGAEKSASVLALAAEAGGLVAGAAVVTVLTLPIGRLLWIGIVVAVGASVGLAVLPSIIHRFRPTLAFQSLPRWWRLVGWYAMVWLVYALGSAALWRAFPEHDMMTWSQAMSVNVASWLVGYLSLITPMGLGVREVTFVTLLPATITRSFGSLIALVTRLWLVVCEIVFLGIVIIWTHRRDR